MKGVESTTTFSRKTGSTERQGVRHLSDRGELPEALREALIVQYGFDPLLSPPQEEALDQGVAEKNGKDFLVCAPTNSGKTLIAIFRIFSAALSGGLRSVYVVPLKALAEEKYAEFTALADLIRSKDGREIKISITTGDYQLTRDFLGSPPPEAGEIVICTPERMEVMLRNPDNLEWARAVGTYVLDEFHLLGDRKRGKTMELLVSRILASCPWSSILSLSATIGGLDRIERWMTHTGRKLQVIESSYRFPQLYQKIAVTRDKDEFIDEYAQEVLTDPSRSLLVFVATKAATRNLAESLAQSFGEPGLVDFFNAGVSMADRKTKAERFRNNQHRILVTTTSLKMGVNFPVTDVIIRDQMLHGPSGSARLSYGDVLQMMGRAGRGNIAGRSVILCGKDEEAEHYVKLFSSDQIDEIEPQLVPVIPDWRRSKLQSGNEVDPMNGLVLTQVALEKETNVSAIESFLRHTYSAYEGTVKTGEIRQALSFLHRAKLVFPTENAKDRWEATKLGRTIVRSGLSPESGAMLAGLLRALINLSEKEREASGKSGNYLRRLTDLDFLFLAVAAYESRDRWLRSPTQDDTEVLGSYLEGLPLEEKPMLYRWRSEESANFPTRRLLSTLKVPHETETPGDAEAAFYRIMRTAILLHRHANGERLDRLAEDYTRGRSQIFEGDLESGLKFTVTWVLSCLSQICDPKKCYQLEPLKFSILDLLEDLSFGSTLGKLLQVKGIGRSTIERLIQQGVNRLDSLTGLDEEALADLGVGRKQRVALLSEVRRRSR